MRPFTVLPPPPTLHVGEILPVLVSFTAVSVGVASMPCCWTVRCSCVAVLVDSALPTAVDSDAHAFQVGATLFHAVSVNASLLSCFLLAWVLLSSTLMLDVVVAHSLLFAGTWILPLLAVGKPRQYICLHRSFTRISRPATPPHSPSFCRPPYRQQHNNMSTSDDAGYSGRLRSSTRANQDDHETGRARSRSRDSRRGEPPEGGFW